MTEKEIKERIEFCRSAMEEIRTPILDGFQNTKVGRERKADGSWVTDIDRQVEEILCKKLQQAFPGERIIGEEFGETSGDGDLCWYIDPIDGTQSFVSGVPLFGSMIGLVKGRQSLLGYVHLPALNESIYAGREIGAWWKPQGREEFVACSVSKTSSLEKALYSTTSKDAFETEAGRALHDKLVEACGTTRGWSDCYGHMLAATGRVDIMIDGSCRDWDSVPFQVITEEAGGRFCSIEGEETAFGKSMVSLNSELFGAFKKLAETALV